MPKNYFLKTIPLLFLFIIGSLYLWQQNLSIAPSQNEKITTTKPTKKLPKAERKKARAEYFHRLMRDPVTNRIPANVRQRELRQAKKLAATTAAKSANGADLVWREVGPTNIGGRTRALAFDQNNNNIILAGGVDGGIWKSTNGGAGWVLTSDQNRNSSVTSLAQDPQNPTTWYFSTGEFNGTTFDDHDIDAQTTGATGIFKSTDNGDSWTFIPFDNISEQFPNNQFPNNNPFAFTSKIVVHPTTSDVFVATHGFGIFRSQDGGTNFTQVLAAQADPTSSNYSDVIVTNTGRLIAYISGEEDSDAGIYVSNDNGDSWGNNITSTAFFGTEGVIRSVLATVPTNPDILYAFTQTESDGVTLFRFNLATNVETNLSANLNPGTDTQGSYNMVLAVHPTNPNLIIIGGVELYRSTDGMTTPLDAGDGNIVGGSVENSHTDQHIVIFDPTNPDVLLNGNDGGIKRTMDIQATDVEWQDLNNGYNVTQYYAGAVKIVDGNGGINIIGGTQDNGTQYLVTQDCSLVDGTQVSIPESQYEPSLQDVSTGDGTFCAIGTNFVYASAQEGAVGRSDIDDPDFFSPNTLDLQPDANALGIGLRFIQHFTLDPNNEAIGYMAAEGGILRNTDLTGADPQSSWELLFQQNGVSFTTAEVSESPANVLYAASYDESDVPTIYRFDNASSGNAPTISTTNIPNMSSGSWVNEIEINPADVNEIVVIVSNYEVESIFHSTDGGVTFTTVQGNLGTNGPSVRDAEIATIDGQKCYFVGTTTGLYMTNTLNGNSTQWTPVATNVIGNVVVSRLDFDQTTTNGEFSVLAVISHGRGIFAGLKTPRCNVAVAPVADFTPNMGTFSLCNGAVTINFTDASTGNPTDWSWTFSGAGVSPTTSTDQNPSVTVNQAGTLTATLTASNSDGNDSQTYTYLVEACASNCSDGIQNGDETGVDCGGSNCPACGIVDLRAFLEGLYDTNGFMSTGLNALLPNSQPFSGAPWSYDDEGTESNISTIPNTAVDWVLIEIRDGTTGQTVIAQRAAFLTEEGFIDDVNGSTEGVLFPILDQTQLYHVVLRTRQHLAVMTANPVGFTNGILSHDFSTAVNQAMGSDQLVEVDAATFALRAGDANSNGVISVDDFNDFMESLQAGQPNMYQIGDWNGNGQVSVDDFNLYITNSSVIGINTIRY